MSRSERIEFANHRGQLRAGSLELPPAAPRAFAVFAHCFTCGKDIAAATRVSRALATKGFGVLRFDFTGLGNSEGDFANTNFSSNVADLVDAARFVGGEPRLARGAQRLALGKQRLAFWSCNVRLLGSNPLALVNQQLGLEKQCLCLGSNALHLGSKAQS